MSGGSANFALRTPVAPMSGGADAETASGGALAIIDLWADSAVALEDALARIAPPVVGVGEARLRRIAGVDRGVVARWSGTSASLMPHAGPLIVRRVLSALRNAGLTMAGEEAFDAASFPEAADLCEALMLDALGRAASPLAVDLLLDQPRRWRAWDDQSPTSEEIAAHSRALDRLLTPPLVVAVGPANVGKSALLNAMAGRRVSIVADEPGVTRDHVGATLECEGLVVRWVDTPGVRRTNDALELEAQRTSSQIIARADLVLSCGDPFSGFLSDDLLPSEVHEAPSRLLCVLTRADVAGEGAKNGGEQVATSALRGTGLGTLARAIRERLVPTAGLDWPGPWRFHPSLCAEQSASLRR